MTRDQINTIRNEQAGAICLFHIGDFYEAWQEDAEYCAKTLGITLTSRAPKGQPVWLMVRFPYHQLESYVSKLVASGKRVAVCEEGKVKSNPGAYA